MVTGHIDLATIQKIEQQGQIPLYGKREIALVRGEGAYLYDSDGRRYLDAMSNYGVAVLGHADPEFADALNDQLRTLTTGHQSFYSDVRAEALSAIARIAPTELPRAFLSNSGAESIEAALKMARLANGKSKAVALKRGYHGRTLGALSGTADPKYRAPFEPLPIEATHVPFNDLDAVVAAIDGDTGAVIIEPVQGEGGIWPASPEFLAGVRQITKDRGVVLIADEIQSGFRTGSPFASVANGIVPDIICTAKALANGFPVGLTLVTEEISAAAGPGTHGSTFGGNPLACRAIVTTLNALEERDLYTQAVRVGASIVDGINALHASKVRAVRGSGLMIGIDLKERMTPSLRALQDRGVLALSAGNLTLRLLPPMIWTQTQVDELLAALEEVLN